MEIYQFCTLSFVLVLLLVVDWLEYEDDDEDEDEFWSNRSTSFVNMENTRSSICFPARTR